VVISIAVIHHFSTREHRVQALKGFPSLLPPPFSLLLYSSSLFPNSLLSLLVSLLFPFRSNSFDVVISISVIHHFSTRDHRVQTLKGILRSPSSSFLLPPPSSFPLPIPLPSSPHLQSELVRILKPGGKLLVYVWAMEQENKTFGHQDVLVPWNMEKKYVEQILEQVREEGEREGKGGKEGKVTEGREKDGREKGRDKKTKLLDTKMYWSRGTWRKNMLSR
jgi:SAM-dependent methyltransferase